MCGAIPDLAAFGPDNPCRVGFAVVAHNQRPKFVVELDQQIRPHIALHVCINSGEDRGIGI